MAHCVVDKWIPCQSRRSGASALGVVGEVCFGRLLSVNRINPTLAITGQAARQAIGACVCLALMNAPPKNHPLESGK